VLDEVLEWDLKYDILRLHHSSATRDSVQELPKVPVRFNSPDQYVTTFRWVGGAGQTVRASQHCFGRCLACQTCG
jgi:hypothetical protein